MRRHVHGQDRDSRRDDRGVVLLITLVILVILATLGYTLSVRVAARRHRNQYIIDYDIARHACASGLKYAMASLGDLQFQLVSRPNEPDFSDVFALSEPEYQELLTQMALDFVDGNSVAPESGRSGWETAMAGADANDVNDLDPDGEFLPDAASLSIRGPYGPPWPLVTEPIEFEVGSAKVKIEIEDENARYPLGWAMITDEKVQAQAAVSWSTFLEWMGYSASEIDELSSGLTAISTMKPFKMEFKPESETVAPPSRLRSRITRPTKGSTAVRRTTSKKTVSVPDQVERQNKDFARFFHSSVMDTDLLARPSILSDSREESAMKYVGLWGARHVNVNSAPRHVLEAAMAFGSVADAPRITDAIIEYRRVKPVEDVNELKQAVLGYSDAIEECRDFVTAESTVFTVRVTAVSGVARITAMAAVSKEGDKIERIAVIAD